ncbi:MAG: lipopolysaccharide assembly protein LapB, partial [Gammaproteobacteria bacterium]
MHNCHVELGSIDAMIDYLENVITRYAGISPVLALADILAEVKGSDAAADFIAGKLRKRPSVRGLSRFIDFSLARSEGAAHANLLILKNMTDQLLENKPVYTCGDCGFFGKALHWQCPGCKHWNTVKPIHGVEGD